MSSRHVSDVAPAPRAVLGALTLDVACVVLFAATGRASHEEQAFGVGLWQTAWPFLVGVALGWLVTRGWRAPSAPLRTGLGVWVLALVGGMLLRAASGQGTALPFIVVAAVVLFVLLVGWRVVARGIRSRARRRT